MGRKPLGEETPDETPPEACEDLQAQTGEPSTELKPPPLAVKKVDAVRAALAEGIDSPDEAVDFIKRRFGIDLPKPQFSSYKSQLKAKGAANAPGTGKPPTATTAGTEGDVVDDLEVLKRLVAKFGADKVRRMVGLFE
jgi:hypothetical protein